MSKTIGIIPARYDSTRFPGKPLIDLAGKSMIQRVYEQCEKCELLSKVIVATDDLRILEHVEMFGGNVTMTKPEHQSGTDRCAEVIAHYDNFDYVVNIQGDEPIINPKQIDDLIRFICADEARTIATQCGTFIDLSDIKNPNVVKVEKENNLALGFHRKLPQILQSKTIYHHIGLYAFKSDTLKELTKLKPSANEQLHKLEQLRWLDNDYEINICTTEFKNLSIDSPHDVDKILKLL